MQKALEMIENSFALLKALKRCGYIHDKRDPWWWPSSGTFEVVVGAILTQQTKWQKVERSLQNLKTAGLLELESLAAAPKEQVATLIKPSGFYNTKAKHLLLLTKAIASEFGNFDRFAKEVDRTWLLRQKGIGKESADAILCYACKKEAMPVDSYTARLLEALGYTFEGYEQIQEWLIEGIEANEKDVRLLYEMPITKAQLYARFHGKIVEYAKDYIRGKRVDLNPLLGEVA